MLNIEAFKYFRKLIREIFTWDRWSQRSWSQEGEDLLLLRIFENKRNGFYVDIGAHHPMRFSNTYLFYLKGWSGINVDAMPGSKEEFDRYRPRDTNVEMGVARESGMMNYYRFNEPALNGFSMEISHLRAKSDCGYYIEDVVEIPIKPLKLILNEYMPTGRKIDFLTIDVEGLDLEVLESNDWSRFRPTYILVEILNYSDSERDRNRVFVFMNNVGYSFFAKQVNTVFFVDKSHR